MRKLRTTFGDTTHCTAHSTTAQKFSTTTRERSTSRDGTRSSNPAKDTTGQQILSSALRQRIGKCSCKCEHLGRNVIRVSTLLAEFPIDVSRTSAVAVSECCRCGPHESACAAENFLLGLVENLTCCLLTSSRKNLLFKRRLTSETSESTRSRTDTGTTSECAAKGTSACDSNGLKQVGDLLTEACDEPLKRVTGVLDIRELAAVGHLTTQVFHLLRNNATTELFSASKLETTTDQKLAGVDTTADTSSEQRAEAGVLDRLQNLIKATTTNRLEVTSRTTASVWSVEQSFSLKQTSSIVFVDEPTTDGELLLCRAIIGHCRRRRRDLRRWRFCQCA